MKKILITGASGYIGRHVVSSLLDRGNEVIAVDVRNDALDSKVSFIEGDVFDPEFDPLSISGPVDACFHLAWRNGFNHSDSSHMSDLSSHYLFLTKLMDKGTPQIAVMGTMHEIGYWEGAVQESTPCNPQSLYGIAKDALRRSFLYSAEKAGTKAQWLRAFYILGDEERSQSVFGKLLAAAKKGDKTFPFTSGKNQYDFIDIEELAEQIAACVSQDEICGIINCCSGRPIPLGQKAEDFIREQKLDIALEYGAYPDRAYDSPAIWGDVEKIELIRKIIS